MAVSLPPPPPLVSPSEHSQPWQCPLPGDRGSPCMTECSQLCSNSHSARRRIDTSVRRLGGRLKLCHSIVSPSPSAHAHTHTRTTGALSTRHDPRTSPAFPGQRHHRETLRRVRQRERLILLTAVVTVPLTEGHNYSGHFVTRTHTRQADKE